MNHSCQPEVLVDNILCVAMKLSVLPSKVTVVTPMVFKMIEHGTQSNFITTAFISGGLGNAFFFSGAAVWRTAWKDNVPVHVGCLQEIIMDKIPGCTFHF